VWARVLAVVVGLWLMAAPAVVGYGGLAADVDRTLGPVVTSVALIATSASVRSLRWLLVPLGVALLVSPSVSGATAGPALVELTAGLVVAASAVVPLRTEAQLGGGWRALRRPGDADRAE
jgi:hypothetical protein